MNMGLSMHGRGFFPESAPRRQNRNSRIGIAEEVRKILGCVGANDLGLNGLGIAASPELKLRARRDIGHALIVCRRKRRRIVEVHRLSVGVIDHKQPLAISRLAQLLNDCSTQGRNEFVGDMPLDVRDQVIDELPLTSYG